MNSRKTTILYWVFLILLTLGILPSAIPSVLALPYAIDHFTGHLGYPLYFLYFTGVTKLLGIVALYIPGFPRIKEWVFAGFVFDLTGAIYSSICVGDGFLEWLPILVDFIFLAALYFFYHKKLSLARVTENNY